MLRRRKSSCPDTTEHHNRRSSSAASGSNNRNGVKLDLYIEDDDIFAPGYNRRKSPTPSNRSSPDYRYSATNIEEMAEEVLCLRLLSVRTRYRFGGLKIHILSPVFSIDKLFNVEFDQDSQVSLIKSQQCTGQEAPTQTPPNDGSKMATIVISPDIDDYDCANGTSKHPTVKADLTLFEEPTTSRRNITFSANSLNRAELDQQTRLHSVSNPLAAQVSQLSFESDNVDFSNVKVYTNLERDGTDGGTKGNDNNILEAIDLETKRDLKKKLSQGEQHSPVGGKRSSMRRHTHFYCYIPSNVSGQGTSQTGSRLNSGDKDSANGNPGGGRAIKRYIGKKMTDTIHSASRFKKYLSDSLFSNK